MWRCSEKYFQGNEEITAEAIVVHFLPDFIGKEFLNMSEASAIISLYERAKSGLMIHGQTKENLYSLMKKSVKEDGMKRMLTILEMLVVLSESRDLTPISVGHKSYVYNKEETDRLNKVYQHALSNYCRELPLDEIAAIANLSVTSFCRYFKMMTKKTFHEFLIELRISHARRLLMDDNNFTIENICFDSGFNNRSNFFRHFKRIVGITPSEFKRKCIVSTDFV